MKKDLTELSIIYRRKSVDLFSRANRLQIFFYERKRQRPETEQFFMETDQ